jgi:hypothetical protein
VKTIATLATARQQLVLDYDNLGVDHAVKVELSAAREGEMFRGVRERFWMRGIFKR